MSLWAEIGVQRRVIGALVVREIYTRFGREGLGFAWLIVEPLMFAVPVLLLWSAVRVKYERGIPTMAMLVTGYVAILLFRHLPSSMILFVRANAALLYHRQVTLFDIFVARSLLEIIANLITLVVTLTLFILLGQIKPPVNLPFFYMGYAFHIWWCIAVALLVGALTERSKLVEKIWPVYAYTYLFFSGFVYLADWLPPALRRIALLQPSLQAYEMMRGGLLGTAIKTYGDPSYTAFVLTVLTVMGLWGLRDTRRYVILD